MPYRVSCQQLVYISHGMDAYLTCPCHATAFTAKEARHVRLEGTGNHNQEWNHCSLSVFLWEFSNAVHTSLLLGRDTLRVVGSRVANSLSSASTEASVTLLSSVLLPALV